MNVTNLIYPMAAMVLLTAVVLVKMYRARVAAIRSGQIEIEYFRLHQGAREPESSAKFSRHFVNLFEVPTLFYVACLAAMVVGVATPLMVGLAWAYVAVRVGHHCARPVCVRYGIPATTRASFYLYTTPAEIDALADGVEKVARFFR